MVMGTNTFEKISGEDEIIKALEELSANEIETAEAFYQICQIIKNNLGYLSVTPNIHNAHQVVSLLTTKLFPNHWLSKAILNKNALKEGLDFTNDEDFGKRIMGNNQISFNKNGVVTPAITRSCSVLLLIARKEIGSSKLIDSIDKLDRYIELTGDLPTPENFREY